MLIPNITRHTKKHKGRNVGVSKAGNTAAYGFPNVKSELSGCYVLKATSIGRVTSKEIESARKAVMRSVKRSGDFYIRIFPNLSITSKPAEVRMGSGKGSIDRWAFRVKPGRILFELTGVEKEAGILALSLAAAKLCIKSDVLLVAKSGLLMKQKKV